MFSIFETIPVQILFSLIIITSLGFLLNWVLKEFIGFESPPNIIPIAPIKSFGGGSSEVKIGLFVNDFPIFNIETGFFSIDGNIWFEYNSSQVSRDDLENFEFQNGTITKKSVAQIKKINNKIFVSYNFIATFSNILDHRNFPVADHRIFLTLKNEKLSSRELFFDAQIGDFLHSEGLSPKGWKFLNKKVETGYFKTKLSQNDSKKTLFIPIAIFQFDFGKPGFRQSLLTLIPPLIILFLSIFSLVLNYTSEKEKTALAISIGGISALIVHRFIIDTISPRVEYFTIIDYLFILTLGSSFLIFLLHAYDLYEVVGFNINLFCFYGFQALLPLFFLAAIKKKGHKHFIKKPTLLFFLRNYKILFPKTPSEFLTLEQFKISAEFLDEFPKRDNMDPLKPDYSSYQEFKKKNESSFFKKVLRKTNWNPQRYSPEYFKKLLLKYYDKNEDKMSEEPAVLLHPFKAGERFYIWGELHGAFHSLIRCLVYLKDQRIIDQDLKLLHPNHFFIFNGNAVNRSAYILETLSLIITLMLKNPHQVIYLKGSEEDNKAWLNSNLKTELEILLGNFSPESPPMNSILSNFFQTLPVTIFLAKEYEKTTQYITISPEEPLLIEKDRLLQAYELSLPPFNVMRLMKQSTHDDSVNKNIIVRIGRPKDAYDYKTPKGLDLHPPEQGGTQWSVFSSPTQSHRDYFEFHDDSFAVVNIEQGIEDTLITHTFRKSQEDFRTQCYDLIAGRPFKDQELPLIPYTLDKGIKIGSTLDLSETASVLGERLKRGLDLCLRKENRENGLHNRLLKIYFADDKYTPSIALKNAERFLSVYNTSLFLASLGTPTTKALLQTSQEKKIPILFPYSGANIFRQANLKNVINYRASYAMEAEALVRYACDVLFKQRFAFFYQEDDYGLAPLNAAKKILLNEYKISEDALCEAPYQRNSVLIDTAAALIESHHPDVLFFFSTYAPSRALIESLDVQRLANVTLMGISFLTDRFRDFASGISEPEQQGKGLTFVISRVVPNPDNESCPIVKEYQDEMRSEYPDIRFDVDSLEGYINSSILIESLKSIQPPYTTNKIIKALESIKDTNFKGLNLNFDPETRTFSRDIWLDFGNSSWIYVKA